MKNKSARTDIVSVLRPAFFSSCASGICICCSPVMISCLWRTGSSTRKLILYQCCIWATSPCLAARHSNRGASASVGARLLFLWKTAGTCVRELMSWGSLPLNHCAAWTPGFYCQAEGTRTHTQTLSTHLCLLYFFFLSAVSDKLPVRHRQLLWLTHCLHGSDIGGTC